MKTETRWLPFFLPLPPWLALLVPVVVGEISNDPWLAFALAIFLLLPIVILFFVFGLAGIGCSLWCLWKTKHWCYWLSLAMGLVTLYYGVRQLVELLRIVQI
jgi:hypothetical protein